MPEIVARDFQFAKVYTASIRGISEKVRTHEDRLEKCDGAGHMIVTYRPTDFAHDDSKTNVLYEKTLDLAVAELVKQAGQERETTGVEIISNVGVIRREPLILVRVLKEETADLKKPREGEGSIEYWNRYWRTLEKLGSHQFEEYRGALDLRVEAIGLKRRDARVRN